jgi:hypothetical protein
MPSSPHSHTTYKIIGTNGTWLTFRDDEFIGGFASRPLAELLVWELVEASCAEQRASEVLIEDEAGCEKYLCRCFQGPPPGTPLS